MTSSETNQKQPLPHREPIKTQIPIVLKRVKQNFKTHIQKALHAWTSPQTLCSFLK